MEMNQTMGTGGSGKQMWLILFLVVVAIGFGVWWYGSRQEMIPVVNNQEAGVLAIDADVQALNTQSSSDEVSAIDADLKATNLNNLDKELGDISNTVAQ